MLHSPIKKSNETREAWLQSILLRFGRDILDRCAYFYAQLCALPRTTRRRLRINAGTGLTALALSLALSGVPTVQAATITVDGGCTLAQAITTANDGSVQGSCIQGDGAGSDTIELNGGVTLTAALPNITSEIIINGNGNTIMGNSTYTVLFVEDTGDLTLNQATITGGDGTGGIEAGYAGGGIYNAGMLTVNNSTITGNSGPTYGGGIGNVGTAVIYNSTVSGNTAYNGGGIYNASGAVMTMSHSTVINNTATSTSYGAGGVSSGGDLTLNRTIVSGNTAPINQDIEYFYGSITADNFNVLGDDGKDNTAAFGDANPPWLGGNDFNATSSDNNVAVGSILNTSLADNGGSTETHALVLGSPAIDLIPNADASCLPGTSVDQRGAARANGLNQGGIDCDAGAFEYASAETPTAVIMGRSGAEAGGSSGGVTAVLMALMLSAGTMWATLRRKG